MTGRRLIEVAFPLKQASIDSVHEKNVRHGHISTLHIWPARRPLAACRAALIATLLPDPGTPELRRELCERIGGKVIKQIEKKKGPGAKGEEKVVEKTVGGILHWGRETENKADVEFLARLEIRVSLKPRELTQIATVEAHEGKQQEWGSILAGELDKARRIQDELGGLEHREVEQAVFATFLHSQPPGARAQLRELLILVGATRPDKITLLKGLRDWFDRSWFLDETADADTKGANGTKPPPSVWRPGSRPNLKQMHADAVTRISDAAVEERLLKQIDSYKPLTAAASQAGARVHKLPEKPAMVDDDGQFRYVVLGPAAASESGKPSVEARRFIEETTAPGIGMAPAQVYSGN